MFHSVPKCSMLAQRQLVSFFGWDILGHFGTSGRGSRSSRESFFGCDILRHFATRGCGFEPQHLSLTVSNRVILCHPWPPEAHRT